MQIFKAIFRAIFSLITIAIASSFLLYSSALASSDSSLEMRVAQYEKKRKYTTNELYKAFLERSSFRHKVLAQNIANANTPGYKANEVRAAEAYEELAGDGGNIKRIKMRKTSRLHLSGNELGKNQFQSEKLQNPDEVKPNGNNVSLRQQMTKLSQNQQDYNAVVKAYATNNSLLSAVIGK